MSNPNTSMFVLSALGIFMLADNALASVSVIGGQVVNDNNQVITLRVAAEPLAVEEADAVAAASDREVTFDATPDSVELLPAGQEEPRQVAITARGATNVIVRHHGVFTLKEVSNGFSITAPPNKTGRPKFDQIDVIWQHPRVLAHMAISVSQNSAAKSPDPQKQPPSAGPAQAAVSLALTALTQAVRPSAIPRDFDAAIRERTEDGSNAIRIILSSADVSTWTVGTAFRRIMEACERQKVWCLLDPGLTLGTKPGTSAGAGVQYFVSENVRTALLEHQDHVMLVLRESETAALGPRAAINQLRAAGLPHMLIFSMKSPRTEADRVDATALLGADGYQAVALAVDPGQASIEPSSPVPVVAMPGVAGEVPIAAAADDSCKIIINKGATRMLSAACNERTRRAGGQILTMVESVGDQATVAGTPPWITAGSSGGQLFVLSVEPWFPLPPHKIARIGFVAIKATDGSRSTALAFIRVSQVRAD